VSLRDKLALFNVELPLERAKTIPSLWYYDPEIYQAEIKQTFLQNWIWAGRTGQLPEPGTFFTFDIGPEPILVAKDKEGASRAFSNVCRHRAARVMPTACGRANYFQCRYHGWTYDLSGKLKGVPEFDGVENFFREENSLPLWKLSQWKDFLFVNGSQSPAQSLSDFLYPFSDRVGSLALDQMKFVGRKEYELRCNWKVFVDNYLDGGYHVNTLHPTLAGVINYAEYRTEIARQTAVQVSPLRVAAKDPTLGEVRGGEAAYYWWVYPNLMFNIYEGLMDINVVLPLGPDRCKVIFDFFFADTEGEVAQKRIAKSLAVAHQIQLEDEAICEEVQRNFQSRSFDTGRFSVRRESGGHHFHQMLARELMSTF